MNFLLLSQNGYDAYDKFCNSAPHVFRFHTYEIVITLDCNILYTKLTSY